MKIKPLRDNVVVKIIDEENKTKSGIIIADTVEKLKKSIEGEIIAIGPNVCGVKVGNCVIFNTIGIQNIKINKKEYYILREMNILAKK